MKNIIQITGLFGALCLSCSAMALDFDYQYETDRQDFVSHDFGLSHRFNETFNGDAGYYRATDQGDVSSTSLSLEIDHDVTENTTLHYSVAATKEIDYLNGRTFGLAGDYLLSNLWQGDLNTFLSLGYKRSNYELVNAQTTTSSNNRRRVTSNTFSRNEFSLGLSQDLHERVNVGAEMTWYNYTTLTLVSQQNDPSIFRLNSFLGTAGFPEKRHDLDASIEVLDNLSVSGNYGKVTGLNAAGNSESHGVGLSLKIMKLRLSPSYTKIKSTGVSEYYSLGLSFN
jgi:hypothetical protein